jgi:uncharacterized protein (DUF2236 family)
VRSIVGIVAVLVVSQAHGAVLEPPAGPLAVEAAPSAVVSLPSPEPSAAPASLEPSESLSTPRELPSLAAESTALKEQRPQDRAEELDRVFDRFSPPKDPAHGLFGPGSMMWEINGHQLGRFGGFAALAVQAAHPLVAESSRFSRELQERPKRRLARTMVLIERMMFADRATALEAVRDIHKRHVEVRGELERAAGKFPAGTPVSALDPALMKHVLGTTYHYTLLFYETFVHKLTEHEIERYYQEMKFFGRLMGLSERTMPERHEAFDAYVSQMLDSDELAPSEAARRMTVAFRAMPWPLSLVLGLPVAQVQRIVVGLLPPRIRQIHGLPWGLKDRLLFPLQLAMAQAVVEKTPDALLRTSKYHRAVWRVRLAGW